MANASGRLSPDNKLSRSLNRIGRVQPGTGAVWLSLEAVLALVVAVLVARLPWYLAVAAGGFVVVVALMLFRPAWVPYIWVFVVALVPNWVMLSHRGIELYPVTGITLAAALHVVDRALPRLRWVDIPVIAFSALVVFAVSLGAPLSTVATQLFQYLAAYFIGRFALSIQPERALHAFVTCMTIVAGLALIEFVTRFNPIVAIPSINPVLESWREIQTRGGIPRAEWSFGHALALGGCLAMAIPLLPSVQWSARKQLVAGSLIFMAILATISRGPLLAAIVGVILAARRRSGGEQRTSGSRHLLPVVVTLVVLAAAIPAALRVSEQAGSELATTSNYRQVLVSETWAWTRPLGVAEFAFSEGEGGISYAQFGTIDNAFLFIALNSGYLPALLLLALLITHFVRAVLKKAGPWEMVVAAQLPLLLTVAFITQLQAFFWMAEGLALAEICRARDEARRQR